MNTALRLLLTTLVVVAAAAAVTWKYWDYVINPWTRNGQVRADVIQVAPRMSGPIVELPIVDNQPVKRGDLLFRIDPRTFEAAVTQAEAKLDETRDQLKNLAEQVKVAEAALSSAETRIQQADSAVASAEANLEKAKKDFDRANNLVRDQSDAAARQSGSGQSTGPGVAVAAVSCAGVQQCPYPLESAQNRVKTVGWTSEAPSTFRRDDARGPWWTALRLSTLRPRRVARHRVALQGDTESHRSLYGRLCGPSLGR